MHEKSKLIRLTLGNTAGKAEMGPLTADVDEIRNAIKAMKSKEAAILSGESEDDPEPWEWARIERADGKVVRHHKLRGAEHINAKLNRPGTDAVADKKAEALAAEAEKAAKTAAAETAAETPLEMADVRKIAADLKIPGRSKMSNPELRAAVAEAQAAE